MKELDFFKNAIDKNRLTHLYLLSGSSGSGKLNLAYEVANLILEKNDQSQNRLKNIKTNNHSQVHYIEPDGNVIKKDQILALHEEFSKTSLVSAARIYIINQVDLISTQAANSLLKFMEEPESNNVYGILITSNIAKVLPTITSRSQVIRVNKALDNHIINYLIANDVNKYKARLISYLTKNEVDALAYSADINIDKLITYMDEFILNYPNNNFKPSLSIDKELLTILYDRKYYQVFIELLLVSLIDIVKYLLKMEFEIEELELIYEQYYNNFNYKKILKACSLLQEELKKLTTYINIGLSLEVLMIKIK